MVDMQDDINTPANNRASKNVDSNRTLADIEAEHSIRKSPTELAQEAFKKDPAPAGGKAKRPRKHRFKNLSKKQKILVIVVLVIMLAGSGFAVWYFVVRKPAPIAVPQAASQPEPAKPTTEPSKLTGREVAPEINKRQVTGVMIENSPDARPQSGLLEAGIVFEAIAEGGITRFLALYQDTQPGSIGPIRSARPYYLEWALPFDASYAHVGGSPDALAAIKSLGVKDLDQFANASAYQRVNNRYAPHNVYSNITALNTLEQQKGYVGSTFTGLAHKKEAPSPAPPFKSIDVSPSSFFYNSHWDYDASTNSYKRSQAGKPHTDEKSGNQIASKTVVVMVMSKGATNDGYHTTYGSTGSGRLYVFQDGLLIDGTWQKSSAKEQFKLTDTAGKTIELNPGQSWVTIISSPDQVVAKP